MRMLRIQNIQSSFKEENLKDFKIYKTTVIKAVRYWPKD